MSDETTGSHTTETPTWLTEATQAAELAALKPLHDLDVRVAGLPRDACQCNLVALVAVPDAVRAAAPIIRRAAEQERDYERNWRKHWARRLAAADKDRTALRAQLADARRATLNEAADAAADEHVPGTAVSWAGVEAWLRERAPKEETARVCCCDLHNLHCEPPSELCCGECTEAAHPDHRDGSTCVLRERAKGGSDGG